MLRLVEIVLFLTPFAAFVLWRLLLPRGPSRLALIVSAGAVALLAALLIWFSHDNTLPPGVGYVPPHVENGVIVQGHGVPQ